jgi:hypothetical protein
MILPVNIGELIACAPALFKLLEILPKDLSLVSADRTEDGNGCFISIPYNNGKITLKDTSKSAAKIFIYAINALAK